MAWTPEPVKTPTAIGRIDHFLDSDGVVQSLRFNLSVLDQNNNEMKVLTGDEVPHLTATQITQLQSFITNRRTNLPTDLGFAVGNLVGRSTWRFRDLDGTNPGKSLFARVVELTAGGQFVQVHTLNDQPNLTQQQINSAITFLDTQRTKAVNEIL